MTGEQIRAYRQKLGLSQTQLGQAFGMAANTIARWERGELVPQWPKLLSLGFRALEQDLRRSRTNKETWRLRRAAAISPQELLETIQATTPPAIEERCPPNVSAQEVLEAIQATTPPWIQESRPVNNISPQELLEAIQAMPPHPVLEKFAQPNE